MPLDSRLRIDGEVVTRAANSGIAGADRASRYASLTLGFTLPTDTVLYLLLPLFPEAFGVSLAEAGLLLAANRLVRIAGYGWVAGLYELRRPRASIIAAGPMLGLIGGAVLALVIGPRLVFLVLAAVALLALPFAVRLPSSRGQRVRGEPRFGFPSRLDVWSFVQGAALDGLFILGLAVLARETMPAHFAIAAGAAMA